MPRPRKRVDLPTGQNYGEGKALDDAQAAVSPIPRDAGLADRPPPPGGFLNGPSRRPTEPVTAGSPIGPGPGEEALQQPTPMPDPDQARLVALVPLLELLASTSGRPVSMKSRQLVRRLRSQVPPEISY